MISLAQHISSRQLSWDAAAAKAGISEERLREVAAGAEASLGEMRRIAKALRIPLSAVMNEASAEPISMLFRQTIDQRALTVASSVEILSSQIQDALVVAKSLQKNTSWLDIFRDLEVAPDYAEGFASIFRKAFCLVDDSEPLTHLPQVIEELGVLTLLSRDPTVEGVSAIVEGYAFILVAARTFRPRMLFTIAHELGHLVAHHDARGSGYALLDRDSDIHGISGPTDRSEEQFADRFASCLLLPQHGVLRFLKAIREQVQASGPLGDIEILWLSRFYGVGFEAAARRCEQLGLLPARGARALYQRLGDDFGNPEKRAEALGLPKRQEMEIGTSPALLRAAAEKVRNGEMSIGRASELLNVPISAMFAANSIAE